MNRFIRSEHVFPAGIALAFGLMVAWNFFFVWTALATAPDVDARYIEAIER